MSSPFYLAIANPPSRSKRRNGKARTMTALQRRYFGKRTTTTSTAKRRRKRAHTRPPAQESTTMARKMTAKQRRYFGKRTTRTSSPRRAKRRGGGGRHSRRGFVNTAGVKGLAIQSAVGAAGYIVGGIVTDKILAAFGRDKPETAADHWTKKPATAAGVKFGVAVAAFMLGRKFAPKYAASFAAGVGTSAAVDGYQVAKGMSGAFGGDVQLYQPRMAG